MDPEVEEHYKELLRQWKNDEDNIKDELKEIGIDIKNLTKKFDDLVTSTVTPKEETVDEGELYIRCTQIFKIRGLSNSVSLNTLGTKERGDAHGRILATLPPKSHA